MELMLFTRDLRVHDQPALHAATAAGGPVLPLFVFDPAAADGHDAPNRWRFLLDGLRDLDAALRDRGGRLVVRRGATVDVVAECIRRHGVRAIHLSGDVTRFARRRESALRRLGEDLGVDVEIHPGVTVVPPGAVRPSGRDHYEVFSPYHRAWRDAPRRRVLDAPGHVPVPDAIASQRLPALRDLTRGEVAPEVVRGGETRARERLDAWFAEGLAAYETGHDDLAVEGTSRLSPYLHLGNLSAGEIDDRLDLRRRGAAAFQRQICWRDFHHQVLWADPSMPRDDHRPRGDDWRDDEQALAAWTQGRTGFPLVDAGMRQLAVEGWMHNRARMVVASFLTKHLYVDWRRGARHFMEHLVDGDVVNNTTNWQWVAGTGTDSRPNRVYNPVRQAERYDPAGAYVRRWVPELREFEGRDRFEPWRSGAGPLERAGYPAPIVDHREAVARFHEARGAR